MKKILLGILLISGIIVFGRSEEVGTKDFNSVGGFCQDGKIISTKKASTADDGVTMIPSSAKIKYSVCKIDGLNYRNIMVIVRSWEENLNSSNVNTKYLPLDGHDISIDYDTRVIYVKGEIL